MVQVLPMLSDRPVILTGRPFHEAMVETKATSAEDPVELRGDVVCTARDEPFKYPLVFRTDGAGDWANPEPINTANRTPKSEKRRAESRSHTRLLNSARNRFSFTSF